MNIRHSRTGLQRIPADQTLKLSPYGIPLDWIYDGKVVAAEKGQKKVAAKTSRIKSAGVSKTSKGQKKASFFGQTKFQVVGWNFGSNVGCLTNNARPNKIGAGAKQGPSARNLQLDDDETKREILLHTRQDVQLITLSTIFLLSAILVMLGIIADRIN